MRIIFATHNRDKMREIRRILRDAASEILAKSDLGIDFDPEEDGKSFAENAEAKAVGIREYMREHGLLREEDVILADDSGLCIDYLRGAPGIYSARFLGENSSYEEKNRRILEKLKGVKGEDRSAHFSCDICAAFSDGRIFHTEGSFPGLIAEKPAGRNGFGYDPILYLPEYRKTSAELSPEEKDGISHRGKALREMRRLLRSVEESDRKLSERRRRYQEELEKEAPGEKREGETEKKRILVVSDSHRRDENLLRVLREEGPFSDLIHLGDIEEPEDKFREAAGRDCHCCFLQGNCDFFAELPRELELQLGKERCFLTHGHLYGVNMDPRILAEEARSRNCGVAMFGHSHKPFLRVVGGVICLNPGSISFPRQADRRPSYMIIEVDERGNLDFIQKYIEDRSR